MNIRPSLNAAAVALLLSLLGSSSTFAQVPKPGVKGYEVESWNGIFAPKGTPKEVTEAMGKAMREVDSTAWPARFPSRPRGPPRRPKRGIR